jgi:hypothetical protein
MNTAFAHEQIYPHIHPHADTSGWSDILLSVLWLGGLALIFYFAFRLIALARRRD